MNACGKEISIQGRLIRIARVAAEGYVFVDDPETMTTALRNSGTHIDLFSFTQKLPETTPKYRYPMEWDNVAALPVSTFDEWWTRQINGKTRNRVRTAEKKGVIVREVSFDDELVQGIWRIYNECPIRQGRRFPHFGKNFEAVREVSGTFLESSVFIGAFLDEELIGFMKLTTDTTRTQAGVMNILAMVRHQDKSTANALIAQAVRSCSERSIPYIVYSSFAYGRKQRDSLSDFKERSGFRRIDLPRYYIPFTRLGSLAFRYGLQHGFRDHIPETALAKLRELRSRWYQHKYKLQS